MLPPVTITPLVYPPDRTPQTHTAPAQRSEAWHHPRSAPQGRAKKEMRKILDPAHLALLTPLAFPEQARHSMCTDYSP